MTKTYQDPVKSFSREKLKDFIRTTLFKIRKPNQIISSKFINKNTNQVNDFRLIRRSSVLTPSGVIFEGEYLAYGFIVKIPASANKEYVDWLKNEIKK